MAEARLRIGACGPLVSYQDGGRFGMSRYGVPASGPMDRLSHAAANAALGRPEAATAIEVSTGGLELVCESGAVTCCVAGGEFQVAHAGTVTRAWCVRTLHEGDALSIRPGRWGSWAYLAFAGDVDCPRWGGSASTHVASGLGGGMLGRGAPVVVRDAKVLEERHGDFAAPALARPPAPVRVVLGPQTEHFAADALAAFVGTPFEVTAGFDRMGMRLAGPRLALGDALSIPSEPIVRGSVQVGGDGVASILLADHQTTGGYPKIATVLSCDIDGLTQLRPHDRIGFRAVDAQEAITLVRASAAARRRLLDEIGRPRGSLDERLLRENLISGMVTAAADDGSPGG